LEQSSTYTVYQKKFMADQDLIIIAEKNFCMVPDGKIKIVIFQQCSCTFDASQAGFDTLTHIESTVVEMAKWM
jgi:hypothetical protein